MARTDAVLLLFLMAQMAIQAQNNSQSCSWVEKQMAEGESTLVGMSSYNPGQRCRWVLSAPTDARLSSTCNFDIPQSESCSEDRVRVWTSGNSTQGDARTFCGAGNATLLSDGAALELALDAVSNSSGGSFSCNVTVVPSDAECDCGMHKQARVVGGEEAGVNEFPFMAALCSLEEKKGASPTPLLFCGASLVSRSFALTAAHCFYSKKFKIWQLRLAVGEHDLTKDAETPYSKWYRLSNYYLHPKFNDDIWDYDIALVQTTEAITMGPGAMLICLPYSFPPISFEGQKVQIMGWGRKNTDGPASNTLQKAEVSVESPDMCKDILEEVDSTGDNSRQFCTTTDGKDNCQGDSGGPIVWQDPDTGREYILGISSFGIGCARGVPSVNTRVTAFLDWIEGIVSKEDEICKI